MLLLMGDFNFFPVGIAIVAGLIAIFVISTIVSSFRAAKTREEAAHRQAAADRTRAKPTAAVRKPQTVQYSATDTHTHLGDEAERYDKIVGSLGEVEDEGCVDLDGIRLIAHDASYEQDEDSADVAEVAKAMVLGDILNNPRFKSRYGKK